MISFRRLTNGSWGIEGDVGEVRVGTLTVTRRDGSTTTVECIRLGNVVRGFGGRSRQVGILAPRATDSGSTDSGTRRSAGVSIPATAIVPCASCGHGAGVIEYREDLVCETCAPESLRAAYRADVAARASAARAASPAPVATERRAERTITAITRVGSLDVGAFMFGGNAVFTVTTETGARFTYRVSNSQRTSAQRARADGRSAVYFVSVLTGSNNETDYSYAGIIPADTIAANAPRFVRTRNSRVGENAPSLETFRALVESLFAGSLPNGWSFHHEGRCARCGRRLTVPESIESGFGPECIGLARRAIAA